MSLIHLEIVTPEKKALLAEVDELIAPGADGLFGVRPGHAPLIARMEPGELSFRRGTTTSGWAIGGGFVEVLENRVTVLADTAESAEEIDLERAKRAREDAAQRLKVSKHDDPEFEVQSMRIKRAAARIRVAGQK